MVHHRANFVSEQILVLLLVLSYTSSYLQSMNPRRQRQQVVSFQQVHSSWKSHVSTHPVASYAVDKLFNDLDLSVRLDLAFLFVAQFHADKFEEIVEQASTRLPGATRLISVVGGGVIGDSMELDEPSKPGLSLLTGTLPNGPEDVELFYFNELAKSPPPPESDFWSSLRTDKGRNPSSFLLFADPWSPVKSVLEALGSSSIIAGGISVPTGTGPTVAIDCAALPQGSLVGVCFKRPLEVQVVVAQGCRPTGSSYTITSAENNIVLELNSKPAMRVLEEYMSGIKSQAEQKALAAGLICGIQAKTMHENSHDDYLIRQMLGFVPSKGGIAVAGMVQTGDKLRFHVRDNRAAEEDLELMVKRTNTERLFNSDRDNGTPFAALQISCVARGRGFFGMPNADLSRTKKLCEDSPIAGFYANGEIGPVGIAGLASTPYSGTFLHGFTTIVALLCFASTTSENDVANATGIETPGDSWG